MLIIMFKAHHIIVYKFQHYIFACQKQKFQILYYNYNQNTYVKYLQHHVACHSQGFDIEFKSLPTTNKSDCICCWSHTYIKNYIHSVDLLIKIGHVFDLVNRSIYKEATSHHASHVYSITYLLLGTSNKLPINSYSVN